MRAKGLAGICTRIFNMTQRAIFAVMAIGVLATVLGASPAAFGQEAPAGARPELAAAEGRPIAEVRFRRLEKTADQFVRNQIRTREGRPFRSATVSEDIARLYRTGRFRHVDVLAEILADGSVAVIYVFEEAQIIEDVQVVGNRSLSDGELGGVVDLLQGTPVDEFQLGRARRAIEELYREKGYFQALVTLDRETLDRDGIVLFRIREGERLRVTGIRFDGNEAFTAKQLRTNVKTEIAGWLFKEGALREDVLETDVVAIAGFYKDRGYLDVRADRELTMSPDGREAIVTFLIAEGPRYTLRDIRVNIRDAEKENGAAPVFSMEQIAGLMTLKRGDVLSAKRVRESVGAIRDAYHRLGYADARVGGRELRDSQTPEVDLLISITEGEAFRVGEVIIQGNRLTKHNVIRRQVQLKPDRPLDVVAGEESRRRLESLRLFQPGSVTITYQAENPADPGYRDVLVEIEETNTASFNFGAAVSTDSGVIGTVSLTQSNFDIANVPTSVDDLLAGRAFRGAGQNFALVLAPGFELQTYSLSLSDPYFLESDYSVGGTIFFRERRFQDYDEQRIGGRGRIGRRFGDRWTGAVSFRAEQVDPSDIDSDAPIDIFEVEGANIILGVGMTLTRTTVPPSERLNPGRGARTTLGIEQISGDFNFTKLNARHELWITLDEDFLGRKKILSLRTAARFIPQSDEAPIYERYFLGGQSFRGFELRGVSPRGIRADTGVIGNDPVGGEWSFFLGAEYLHPIWGNVDGRAIMSGVLFIDTGTVRDEIGFGDYRVSVGFGLRLLLPISPVPLAFDFGFPIAKEDGDEEQFFNFSIDLPF